MSSFLFYILAVGTGIINLNVNLYIWGIITEVTKSIAIFVKKIFLLIVFVILFLIRKIPLKTMAKQVILFAILLSLAFLTACLYKINIFLFIILSIFWILIFILTQQNENLRSVGLFT